MRRWVMVKEKIVKEDGRYLIYYRFKKKERDDEPTDDDQPSRLVHQSYYAGRRRDG